MFACKFKQNKYKYVSVYIAHIEFIICYYYSIHQRIGQSEIKSGHNGLIKKRQRYNKYCLLKFKINLRFT